MKRILLFLGITGFLLLCWIGLNALDTDATGTALLIGVPLYVMLVYVVGAKATVSGRNRRDWMLIGVLITPVLALALLLIMGPVNAVQGSLRPCPYCAETIQAAAIKCRFCGSEVTAV